MSARRMSTWTRSAELSMSAISASAWALSKSPADERELGAEQPNAAVLYRKEPDQPVGSVPVAQDEEHSGKAGAELVDAHVRP
jgi:hypothetical protein